MRGVVAALAALAALVWLALAGAPCASPGQSRSISVRPMRKYIINLDKRTDRMAVTVPKLHRFGFDVERWPAVDARRMSRGDVEGVVRPDARAPIWRGWRAEHSELSLGAVGCFLSHLQIWASLAEAPEGVPALVFEDDTDPTITSEQVDAALVGLPDDWDIVFLGVFGEPYDPARLSIRRVQWFFGAHAYIIRRRCAQNLLASALPMHVQLDSWLSRLSMSGLVRLYAIANSGWAQNAKVSETDIQTPVILGRQI